VGLIKRDEGRFYRFLCFCTRASMPLSGKLEIEPGRERRLRGEPDRNQLHQIMPIGLRRRRQSNNCSWSICEDTQGQEYPMYRRVAKCQTQTQRSRTSSRWENNLDASTGNLRVLRTEYRCLLASSVSLTRSKRNISRIHPMLRIDLIRRQFTKKRNTRRRQRL